MRGKLHFIHYVLILAMKCRIFKEFRVWRKSSNICMTSPTSTTKLFSHNAIPDNRSVIQMSSRLPLITNFVMWKSSNIWMTHGQHTVKNWKPSTIRLSDWLKNVPCDYFHDILFWMTILLSIYHSDYQWQTTNFPW